MVASEAAKEIRREQGFAVYVLRSREVELAIVPELGARIVSLRDRRTGREWMWHPEGDLKLFRNRLGDDFATSTLAGADECVPTIAPCEWQGRNLPDHGEVWSTAWQLDEAAWNEGVLRTSVELAVSPFAFQRSIRVSGGLIRMDYSLTNRNSTEENYLWALHPLFQVQRGDRLDVPPETRAYLQNEAWIDALDTAVPNGGCAKAFAGPIGEGWVGIINTGTGDRLVLEWDPAANNTLGLWLTRGGWHGHHHFAMEPTNGAPDPLAEAAKQGRCGLIPAFGSAAWTINLVVGT